MLLCGLLTSASCWLGYELVSLFVWSDIDVVTRVGIGMPVGIVFLGWVFYVLNLVLPFSMQLGLVILTFFTVAATLLHFLVTHRSSVRPLSLLYLIVSVFAPTVFLCWLMLISILFQGNIVRGAVYADLPFHLNLITSWVHGCNQQRKSLFGNVSPFFAGEPLAYPVIVNFISSIMVGCFGTELQWAIVIPSFPFAFSLFSVLSRIVFHFSGRPLAICVAPFLFLFIGGNGWTHTFDMDVLRDMNSDMVHHWGRARYEYWFHPVLHVLLPQRLSLFSMPICWAYILLLMIGKLNRRIYFLSGILVGILPQVQGHSLVTLFEWTLAYGALNFPWKSVPEMAARVQLWAILGAPALLLSIPQLAPFVGRVMKESFWTFVPVWADDKRNFFRLWWFGLGVFWALALFHCLASFDSRQFKLYLPSLFVFAVSNLVHYQPWNLDNTKVFYNGWVPLAVAAAAHFLATLQRTKFRLGTLLMAILALAACGSSALGLWKAICDGGNIWDEEDVYTVASWAINNSHPKSVWLTDSDHNHPISCLAGRQILVGYRGWLPSHHLNDQERIRAIIALDANPDDTTLIDRFNVDFICFNLQHSNELNFRFSSKVKSWKLAYRLQKYEVWQRVRP
jgi:hypothetical protein